MATDSDKTSERIFAEGLWQKRLLEGELSPAEYAARVVADPVRGSFFYRAGSRYNSSVRRPLVRARVLLLLALLCGLFALALVLMTPASVLAIGPGLGAALLVIAAAFWIARSSAAQEIWLLNHEIREQRNQLRAFEVYGDHVNICWNALAEEAIDGAVTSRFVVRHLRKTRLAMEEMRGNEVALAILRLEHEQYFLSYSSIVPRSPLGRIVESADSATELFQGIPKDIFTSFVRFEIGEITHELVALSTDPFSTSEQWLLRQLAIYCSTSGALAST